MLAQAFKVFHLSRICTIVLAQDHKKSDPKLWVILAAGMAGRNFLWLLSLIRLRVRIIYLTIVKDLHYNVGADQLKDLHLSFCTVAHLARGCAGL